MIVVADTSPINYLVLLGHIEILPKIYGEVLIPQAVYDELQDSDAPAEVRAWLETSPTWLKISNISYQPDPYWIFWIEESRMQFCLRNRSRRTDSSSMTWTAGEKPCIAIFL